MPLLSALVLALALAPDAHAQVSCAEPYPEAKIVSELEQVDAAIRGFDLDLARSRLVAVHKGMLCIDTVVKPSHVAKMARQLSMIFFFDQDEAATTRWGLGSRYAWPDAPWPSDMPDDHPMRESLSMHDLPSAAGPADKGMGLVVPKGGAAFMDGRPFHEPRAPIEVPVFIQITDKKGVLIRQFWQDGAAFPEDLIGDASSAPTEAPKWYVPEPAESRIAQRSPLWGEADDAVAAAPPPPPPAPKPPVDDGLADAAVIVVPTTSSVQDYVDPFTDAKMRAVVKERSVRTEVDASGASRTITTEVVTFVEDKASVPAVTAEDFAAWIAYRPEWQRDAAVSAGRADANYLKGWTDGAPAGDRTVPVVWISWQAAKAYCDDWSSGLAGAEASVPPLKVDEWRLSAGQPAVRTAKGKVKAYTGDTAATAAEIGFRCVD